MTKALVVLSGGQDSTTCLFWARERFDEVHAITFSYGQRHSREIDAAIKVVQLAGLPGTRHEVLHLPVETLKGSSPLINRNEKLEQYQDWQHLPGGLEKTFVPARNALFMVLAANRAYCLGVETIVLGICQEDFGGYPDCREVFRSDMEATMRNALEFPVHYCAPLMYLTKAQSVKLAHTLPGCWEALAYTHTSYDGAYPPTGNDHATLLRAKGFEEAGLPDPLVLRAYKEGLMPLPPTPNYDTIRTEEMPL